MNPEAVHPVITIGIPCFNAQETIARALNSALAQTWPEKEILVVDDASDDSSAAVVEKIAGSHSGVRLVRHAANKGPGGTRQTIVEQARGDFIAFFDDDDESLPARLQAQFDRLTSYERQTGVRLAACYASGRRSYPNGYEKILPAIGSYPQIPHGSGMADFILFYGKKPGWFYGDGTPSCSLMARRETFVAVGGFDPAFRRVEDMDYAVRLALAGGHFIGCPESLFIQHATAAPDKAPRKNLDAELMLVEKHRVYLESAGWYDYARRWPLVRYYHFAGEHGRMIAALLTLLARHPVKTIAHFLESAPRRFLHERRIAGENRE
jgi:glycosyltransferase involved in cell wall biosynthesis